MITIVILFDMFAVFSVKLHHLFQRYDRFVEWQHFVVGDAQSCLIQLLMLIRVVKVVVVIVVAITSITIIIIISVRLTLLIIVAISISVRLLIIIIIIVVSAIVVRTLLSIELLRH